MQHCGQANCVLSYGSNRSLVRPFRIGRYQKISAGHPVLFGSISPLWKCHVAQHAHCSVHVSTISAKQQ